jgi:hypothetical protein
VDTVIIRCHQCGDAVTPELPWFDFDAVAVCDACAEKPLESCDEESFAFHRTVTDIDGNLQLLVDASPDGLAQLRKCADACFEEQVERFRGQLPMLKDAYLSMTRGGRKRFREYVMGFAGLRTLEAEGLENPFAVFQAELLFTPLKPAPGESVFAGNYVGDEEEDIFWVKALPAAVAAWDAGREFEVGSVDAMKKYE